MMAREFQVQYNCDVCRRPATYTELPVQIGKAQLRTLELCTLHFEEIVRPLVDMLAIKGTNPQKPKARNRQRYDRMLGPYLCKAGCIAAPLKNPVTFAQHLTRVHEITLADYIAEHGELVPLTLEELEGLNVEIRCEQPGCKKVYSTKLGNRFPHIAMQAHMWGHHGIKWRPTDV